MNCYAHQLACAAACTTAILYTIGAGALMLFPTHTAAFFAPVIYLSAQQMPLFQLSFIGYLYGLVQSFIYTYTYARIFNALYNALLPE